MTAVLLQRRLCTEFEPGTIIELTEPGRESRKFAWVDDSGVLCLDRMDAPAPMMPIYSRLSPIPVPEPPVLVWKVLEEHGDAAAQQFDAMLTELLDHYGDPLAYRRAAWWAYTFNDYDWLAASVVARLEADRLAGAVPELKDGPSLLPAVQAHKGWR